MPKPKHNKVLLRSWLVSALTGDIDLVSASVRDAESLRNALYHLQGRAGIVRIARHGRRLTLRVRTSRETTNINARTARLRPAPRNIMET